MTLAMKCHARALGVQQACLRVDVYTWRTVQWVESPLATLCHDPSDVVFT